MCSSSRYKKHNIILYKPNIYWNIAFSSRQKLIWKRIWNKSTNKKVIFCIFTRYQIVFFFLQLVLFHSFPFFPIRICLSFAANHSFLFSQPILLLVFFFDLFLLIISLIICRNFYSLWYPRVQVQTIRLKTFLIYGQVNGF